MFRLDRFLTLHVFKHLTRILPHPKGMHIPILMYHSISDDPENGIHPYYRINTSPKRFAEHMQFLHDNNYKVIDLSEAVRLISAESSGSPNPPSFQKSENSSFRHSNIPLFQHSNKRFVVLTFDDGYQDFYTYAFPILNQYGFPATVFLPTSFIDGRKPGLKGKEHLDWSEVTDLQKQGILFGSHTVSHSQLRTFTGNEIEYEVKKSKEVIEEKTGQHVKSFSYPYAFPEEDKGFVRILRTLLRSGGYENGVTTRIGTIHTTDEIYFLKRIPLNSEDDVSFFRVKLEGDYDWVYGPQVFSKFLRKQLSFSINSRYTSNIE